MAAGEETFRMDPLREMWREGEILLSALLAAVPWRPKKAVSTASKPQSAIKAANLKWGKIVKYLSYYCQTVDKTASFAIFGCCTADSQTEAGRHQLSNNGSLVTSVEDTKSMAHSRVI